MESSKPGTTWEHLENVLKNSLSQRPCVLLLHVGEMSRIGKYVETYSRHVVASAEDKDRGE